jgi:hypothetical protein
VGSRVLISQPKLPDTAWQITEFDEQKRIFTWIERRPGLLVTARHRVERHARGSLAMLSIEFSGVLGPLVGRLTRRLNDRYLAIEANGLRRYCEASTASFVPSL